MKQDIKPGVIAISIIFVVLIEIILTGFFLAMFRPSDIWNHILIGIVMIALLSYAIGIFGWAIHNENLEAGGAMMPILCIYLCLWVACAYLLTIHLVYGIGAITFLLIGTYLVWESSRTWDMV